MNTETHSLWARLLEHGYVTGSLPVQKKLGSPWYVKSLMAFSGWLAAIFMLIFLAVAFEFIFENGSLTGVIGMLLIGVAWAFLRFNANDFVEHLALALSIAGQALMAYGLYEITDNTILTWLTLALLEGVLAMIMPNFIHGVMSSMAAAIAFSMAFSNMAVPHFMSGVVMLGASLCWLNECKYPRYMKKIRALGYGLFLALIALEGTILFKNSTFGMRIFHEYSGFWAHPWFGEVILSVVTLYVVWSLLHRYGHPINGRLALLTLLASLFLCAVSLNVHGLTVGMVIVLLGFSGSNRILLGLGIVFLLFYISSYYYMLDRTLLEKSLSLLSAGLFLLCVRWFMNWILPIHKEVHHG